MDYKLDSCWKLVLLCAVFLQVLIPAINARQCYVCGIGPSDPMYDTMLFATSRKDNSSETIDIDPLSCAQLEKPDTNPDAYLVECPAGNRGCFTQIDGATTVRSCNRFPIDDCKIANRITYCYCNTDRCNSRDKPIVLSQDSPRPAKTANAILNALGFLDPHELEEARPDDEVDDDEGGDDIDRDAEFEASGSGADPFGQPPLTTTLETLAESSKTTEELAKSLTTTTESPLTHRTPRPRLHVASNRGGDWRLAGLSRVFIIIPGVLVGLLHSV